MKQIIDFVKMSKYAGERFDLIQAGGGNTSVKLDDGRFIIKASGFLLSDVEVDKGYATLNLNDVCLILNDSTLLNVTDKRDRETYSSELLSKAIIEKNIRPSIETFLHSLLYKYTLHTHPVVVNAITFQENWREILTSLFGDLILMVDYKTPGIDLALEMKQELDLYRLKMKSDPNIVFLQNHGLIVSANSIEDVKSINEEIITKLEDYLNVNFTKYKLTNKLSNLINSINDSYLISYNSCDTDILDLISRSQYLEYTPFCPDGYVFCGVKVLSLNSLDDSAPIVNYKQLYNEFPKVIFYNNMIFFIATNIRKAKEIEDVFKFHLLSINSTNGLVNTLPIEEIRYLGNWEAEKFRQNI